MATEHRAPEVRFVEYADNSINFEVLVWFDIRKAGMGALRSRLYFTIFEALKQAGMEIPFPQRDIHIRSGLTRPEGLRAASPVQEEAEVADIA
jgi:small-conductance mechanosensitive channel